MSSELQLQRQEPVVQRVGIGALMEARTIAVVGASSDPRKIGGRPIAYMLAHGFVGDIYPVNPTQSEVQGLPAYAALAAIGKPVDQVIIAIPGAKVEAAVEEALALPVKSIVILSSGFGEIDHAGLLRQQRIAERCAAAGVALLGPNCIGMVNARRGQFSTFMSALEHQVYPPGDVAIVSQSGAIGSYLYGMAGERGIRFSHFLATGNEAGADVADCIAWLATDPGTRVVMAYIEGCRDGDRLRAALEAARRARKPVIVMKAGASEQGAAAATSHTGSLAGSDAVYETIFRSHNARRVHSMQEMCDLAYACSVAGLPLGNRLGVITPSGGVGVIVADTAATCGLVLPPLSVEAQEHIRAIVPFSSPVNPVDTTGQTLGDRSLLTRIMDVVFEHEGYDAILCFNANMGQSEQEFGKIKTEFFRMRAQHPTRIVIFGSRAIAPVVQELEAHRILYFDDPTRATAVLGALVAIAAGFDNAAAPAPAGRAGFLLPPGPINEARARELLESAGIPFVPQRVVTDVEECVTAGAALGFPLAAKVLSPDILHKSDAGGVRINISDEAGLREAWTAIMTNVARHSPQARVEGLLLSPMVQGGVEIVLGVARDPVFGPVVMCGLGGVFVEIFKDVAFLPAPVSHAQALGMVKSLKALPLLQGARGRPPADMETIAAAIVDLSDFALACGESLASVEINPFISLPTGGWAVDALIVRPETAAAAVVQPKTEEPCA
ncbi:acetate--CoA ligase family protein [Verticiella sediminum]|nr:acetate--CoA ligase family protein [Verticiella sediminum]